MNIEVENNKVFLQGEVLSEPAYNHTVKNEQFYSMDLRVPRLSGQFDIIPLLMPKQFVDFYQINLGSRLAIFGQFRSYNKIEDEKRKLVLSVFVKEVRKWDDSVNANIVELDGYVCKPSVYRTTPFSREICDVLLAVNRNFNKSDYIPCIAWGSNAQIVSKMNVSSPLKVMGRIQSREYTKSTDSGTTTHIAYEVSISKLLNL